MHADEFAVVVSVRENKLKRAAHVEESGVVPAVCLARFLRLNTSDDIIVARVLHGKTAGEKGGDDHFVVVISGESDSRAGKLGGFNHKFMRRSVPNANREGGLGKTNVHGRLNAEEGKIVCRVESVLCLTARDEILEKAVAGKTLGGGGVADFV